jgi:hypothetical protein
MIEGLSSVRGKPAGFEGSWLFLDSISLSWSPPVLIGRRTMRMSYFNDQPFEDKLFYTVAFLSVNYIINTV